MGATTSGKRRETRRAPSPSSHIQREVIGVILIALSLLMLLSLLSFVPGEARIVADGASGTNPPRNLIGSFGALLAGAFFYGIGGAAYLFPLLLGRLGFRCFSQAPVSLRLRTAASSLAAVFFLSAFLHLETTGVPTLTSGMISRGMAGGVVGQTIAEGLRAVFAGTGAHILVITGFLVSLLLTTPLSLAEAVRRMPERWATLLEGVSAVMPERSIEVQKEVGNRRSRSKPSRSIAVPLEESDVERSEEVEPIPASTPLIPIIQPF
ncbi:MAG TPA: DNA translocase FtsK 4TM domain-containing protein, partial [Nitrospira sp.]|nr:DNA translocase FtsK 4TM domain-containing protein [Nitrospira sp.]